MTWRRNTERTKLWPPRAQSKGMHKTSVPHLKFLTASCVLSYKMLVRSNNLEAAAFICVPKG